MSSASSVLPSDLVSVEVAAQQVGAHPQTSLTRCMFPVLYPVLAPERGPEWQTHARRRNLGRVLRQTVAGQSRLLQNHRRSRLCPSMGCFARRLRLRATVQRASCYSRFPGCSNHGISRSSGQCTSPTPTLTTRAAAGGRRRTPFQIALPPTGGLSRAAARSWQTRPGTFSIAGFAPRR